MFFQRHVCCTRARSAMRGRPDSIWSHLPILKTPIRSCEILPQFSLRKRNQRASPALQITEACMGTVPAACVLLHPARYPFAKMSVAFCPSRLSLSRAASARPSVAAHAKVGNWLPGAGSPAILDGSLPGDYGFDPLGLVRSR